MTDVRNFDDDDTTDLPPGCEFVLGGREWTCRNVEQIPLATMEAIYEDRVQIGPFFDSVLIPEQVPDFRKMFTAYDSALTFGRAESVVRYIVEKLIGRPTKPAGSSSAGTRRTARTSKASSSARGTTRAASAG